MSRPNPFVLAMVLLGFVAVFGGMPLMKGGLYLDAHEGDSYHLLDVVFRIEAGLRPHQDFVTPLGFLTFGPIVLFLKLGIPVGTATILAQGLVGLLLWPFVVYAAATRLTRPMAYFFGLSTLCLALALSYGGADSGATISMHYNRWGWAIAFVALCIALLPPRGTERPRLDGAIVGLLAGCLLLLKITYFVAVVPAAAVALAVRWKRGGLLAAVAGGAAVVLVATLFRGPGFWLGYLGDLVNVTGSEVRPFVGVPLSDVIASPEYFGASMTGIAAVILVRRTGQPALALSVLLMLPGFIYVTYQNFGNDPEWLLFLPVLLMSLRPAEGFARIAGADLRAAMASVALVAGALIFPSLANIALSPIEHAAFPRDRFVPMLPAERGHQDIFIRLDRANTMTAQVHLDETRGPWAKYSEDTGREPPLEFGGVRFASCEWMAGSRAYFVEFTRDLQAAGIPPGSQFFTTDILTAFWLFGPYAPLQEGAPWYYGELSGIGNADYILIPKCSFVDRVRRIMIGELNAADPDVELVRDNELYALFALR